MPKTKISEFDVDPANNTDINSINIAEGCAPSGINNAIRQLMSDLKEQLTGASGDPFTVGGAFAANGGATLGDASGDALTINSSAVSIPNGLNFDSNTLVIDATNNRVGVGGATTGFTSKLLIQHSASEEGLTVYETNASGNFSGVANTGARLSAFQLLFNANGSERMRINSSGNVGIGTSAPPELLSVTKGNAGIRLDGAGTASSSVWLDYYVPNNGGVSTASNFAGRVYAVSSGSTNFSDNSIRIAVPVGGSATPVDTLTVKAGNVGIGTSVTLANARLDVRDVNRTGNASNQVILTTTSQAAEIGGTLGLGGLYDGSNSTVYGVLRGAKENSTSGNYAGYLSFGTVSNGSSITEKMRLDSSGNLGLGVTPSAWGSGITAMDFGKQVSISSHTNGGNIFVSANTFYNGTNWIYKETRAASQYQQNNGLHAWYNAPSGTAGNAITFTQAMTLSAAGNLGIGTTSPVDATNQKSITIDATTTSRIDLRSGGVARFNLQGNATETSIVNEGSTPFVYYINGAERMRITSSGNLGIGTASPTYRCDIQGNTNRGVQLVVKNADGNYGRIQFGATSDSLNYYIGGGNYGADWTAGSGVAMSFTVNQNATPATASLSTSGVWTNASDKRYKENIKDLNYGLDEVLKLQPRLYNIKGDSKINVGLIAQEVLEVIPEVVDSVYCEPLGEDRYTLAYGSLVAVAFKAIQEQQAIINDLKARIETLESK